MIQHIFEQFPNVIAGTTTREFGNFSIHEKFPQQEKNKALIRRQNLLDQLSFSKLYVAHLIHTDHILNIPQDSIQTPADALITSNSDALLAVTTADCIPVFLYAPDKNIVGIVHCGRKGLLLEIVPKTILKMKQDYDIRIEEIYVHIGVHICKNCYKVSPDIIHEFNIPYTSPYLDMKSILKDQLKKIKVLSITENTQCTLCSKNNDHLIYFSHRNNQEPERILSFIGIRHI